MKQVLWTAVQEKLEKMKAEALDPEWGLLQEKIKERNYHTSYRSGVVHRVKENAEWLPALLKTGREEDQKLALAILDRIVSIQNRNKAALFFGIWPYLFEEPIEQMQNPDWNWAAFIGRVMLILLWEYPDKISKELQDRMKESLCCACESIERRNMGVDYTNISLMSSFVLISTGELLEEGYYLEKGLRNLKQQLDFAVKNGGFAEYNSPAYGVIDIEETGRILRYCRTKEALETGEMLHDLCWKVLAEHYHAATGQIAAPHARCYEDIQSGRIKSLFAVGTDGACMLNGSELDVNLLWPFTTLKCPEKYRSHLISPKYERVLQETFYRGYDPIAENELRILIEKGSMPLRSYTYFHPDYCLGSFERHDMWNQRRPLMAYFAVKDRVLCFRVRCLHDRMDFAGGVLDCIQEKGRLAGGISFVHDHGDYHYILTPLTDGCMIARELCVEFSITGESEKTVLEENAPDEWTFEIENCKLKLKLLKAVFDGKQAETEIIDTSWKKGVNVVLYCGSERQFDFCHMGDSFLLFALEILSGEEQSSLEISEEQTESFIRIGLKKEDGSFGSTMIPKQPGKFLTSQSNARKMYQKGGFFYYEDRLF